MLDGTRTAVRVVSRVEPRGARGGTGRGLTPRLVTPFRGASSVVFIAGIFLFLVIGTAGAEQGQSPRAEQANQDTKSGTDLQDLVRQSQRLYQDATARDKHYRKRAMLRNAEVKRLETGLKSRLDRMDDNGRRWRARSAEQDARSRLEEAEVRRQEAERRERGQPRPGF
ncbi:MAG: hypothetical protein V2B18_07735 [Pseudomonadota bacterium]